MPKGPSLDSTAGPARSFGLSESVHSDANQMPEFQPVSSAYVSAIERPGCPKCWHHRMLLSKLEPGPSGFDYRTFECQKCGFVETAVASRDPMNAETEGWLASELRPPT